MKPQRTDEDDAWELAEAQAGRLAKGLVDATELTATDRNELIAIRRLCAGTPALATAAYYVCTGRASAMTMAALREGSKFMHAGNSSWGAQYDYWITLAPIIWLD